MEHQVKKGQKLVGVFFQEPKERRYGGSLNIVTRPMRGDEQPETYEIETVFGEDWLIDAYEGSSIPTKSIKIIES